MTFHQHRAVIRSLGCKVNQCDAEATASELRAAGCVILDDSDATSLDESPADLCIVYTCSVTAEGDRKSRQMIRHLIREHPNALMVVAGCYAEVRPDDLRTIDGVDMVVGTSDAAQLLPQIYAALDIMEPDGEKSCSEDSCRRTRAFVKIQDGCDQFCSYCQIPLTRGTPHSRDTGTILKEVRGFVEHGHLEVVLCGIRLGAFGMDRGDPNALAELLRQLDTIEGLVRYRLSSIEPNDFGEPLLKALPELKKLAPHFHIPLQSGSDTVLQRMNRRYTAQDYQSLIKRLQSLIPNLAVSTDVLVGFPGETEEEARETEVFVEKMLFSKVHLFPFSPRPGTVAADLKPRISAADVRCRKRRLEGVTLAGAIQFRKRFVGSTLQVLIEGKELVASETGKMFRTGFSENYLRVAIPTSCEQPLRAGEVYDTVIERLDRNMLLKTQTSEDVLSSSEERFEKVGTAQESTGAGLLIGNVPIASNR